MDGEPWNMCELKDACRSEDTCSEFWRTQLDSSGVGLAVPHASGDRGFPGGIVCQQENMDEVPSGPPQGHQGLLGQVESIPLR
jgi:hypothetical protein